MKVLKFGTASISSVEKIMLAADIVAKEKGNLIVLSSIKGTAEDLAELSNYLYNKNINSATVVLNRIESNYTDLIEKLYQSQEIKDIVREALKKRLAFIKEQYKDLFTLFDERAVMAQGELLSSDIFYHLLKERGLNIALISALDIIKTDRNSIPDSYYIKEKLNEFIEANVSADYYLTQGYICRNAYGEIDDLRKGGSDYTASLVGAAVNASEIQIWSDVEVMLNNDSHLVNNTFTVRHLNFDEAAELAYFGAKILHPTCIAPAKLANIPVRLKCTQKIEDDGTLISNVTEANMVKAVAARDGIVAIRIKSGEMLLAHGFLRKVFEIFERYQTPVDMITSSEIGISVTIDNSKNLEYIIDDLQKYGTVTVDSDMVLISVVGDFDTRRSDFAADIISAVKETPIRMISYGGSKCNLSLLVTAKDKHKVLQSLNNELFKEQ